MSVGPYSEGAGARPTLRPRRRPARAVGAPAPAVRQVREVEGIGRNRARHYCPDCGRKYAACTCPPAAA